MKILFRCPECERAALVQGESAAWRCPACDHMLSVRHSVRDSVPTCGICGNADIYKKKDFPHWLGLAILAAACLAFLLGHKLYHPWVAWAILLGSAAFDWLLYLWVGDALVCYRCGALHRGVAPRPEQPPFDLGTAERYRQERLRRDQLEAEKKARG